MKGLDMKKYLTGFLVGAILFVPAGAFAWVNNDIRKPNVIYQFNCTPDNRNIDNESLNQCNNGVAVFDDAGNKCYLSYDNNGAQSSISCVRGSQ